MPPVSPEVARIRSRIATTRRYHPDRDVTADREALQRAKYEAHIANLIAEAPPMEEAQKDRLRGLLADVPVYTSGSDRDAQ